MSKNCFGGLFAVLLSLLSFSAAHAQIVVTNLDNNTLGAYNLDGSPVGTGTLSSDSSLQQPSGIAQSGSDLYVTNYGVPTVVQGVTEYLHGTVNEYTTSGTPVGGAVVSNLYGPNAIAVSGSNMFVVVNGTNSVQEYTTSGATVGIAPLISGLVNPDGIAISGSTLFVANYGLQTNGQPNGSIGTIGEYTINAATGVVTASTPSLITGLGGPYGMAISGSDLYVAEYNTGTIGEYTLNADGTVNTALSNPALINGALGGPTGIVVSGQYLFIADYGANTVEEYTTSGTKVGTLGDDPSSPYPVGTLLFDAGGPLDIVVVPEPSTWALLAGGLGLLAFCRLRTRRTAP